MATTNPDQAPIPINWGPTLTNATWGELEDSDSDSLNSLETDDGEEHLPEKIIAEVETSPGTFWYLVKWENCPLLRSSWEGPGAIHGYASLSKNWEAEKQRQKEGKTKPLDISAFSREVERVEDLERTKRKLRRLKRKFKRVLRLVTH
jgi:hypothetical protein